MSATVISGAVPPEIIAQVRAKIAGGPFISGKATAVGHAVNIKNNLVLAPDSPAAKQAVELLAGALHGHPTFQAAVWPEGMLRPLFCRYDVGMSYGDHIDGALMGEPPEVIRCDVAVTVCLNDAADYDGGELVIDSAGASRSWKGRPGDAIVYPADTLHRVNEVTRGVRDVAITWVQSMVREPDRRRTLFDLKTALDALDREFLPPKPPPPYVDAIRRSYFNLIRMWV